MKDFEGYARLYTNTSQIKILVVRNPEERFLSAYMDKIYSLKEFGRIGYHGKSVPTLDRVGAWNKLCLLKQSAFRIQAALHITDCDL